MHLYKSPTISWQVMGDFIYILEEMRSELHILDSVAKDIWLKINGLDTVEEIAAIIAKEYDQPYEVVLTDVKDFVDDLLTKSLITASTHETEVTPCC